MRSIVINFLQFNVMSIHPAVYWGLAAMWIMMLTAGVMSLKSLSIPFWAKFLWFLIIFALPVVGLALYALRCLIRADWYFIKPIFQSRKMDKQLSSPIKASRNIPSL